MSGNIGTQDVDLVVEPERPRFRNHDPEVESLAVQMSPGEEGVTAQQHPPANHRPDVLAALSDRAFVRWFEREMGRLLGEDVYLNHNMDGGTVVALVSEVSGRRYWVEYQSLVDGRSPFGQFATRARLSRFSRPLATVVSEGALPIPLDKFIYGEDGAYIALGSDVTATQTAAADEGLVISVELTNSQSSLP